MLRRFSESLNSALKDQEQMKEGLANMVKFGIKRDLNPALPQGTHREQIQYLYAYISEIDRHVRSTAEFALRGPYGVAAPPPEGPSVGKTLAQRVAANARADYLKKGL